MVDSTTTESATTWEGVCLSVRLAEGVHKQWLCAISDENEWNYLRIQRWSPGKIHRQTERIVRYP